MISMLNGIQTIDLSQTISVQLIFQFNFICSVHPSKMACQQCSLHDFIFIILGLLIHLLLKRWSCNGKSTGSRLNNVTSSIGLDSEFSCVSCISILSRLTSNTDNSRVDSCRDTVIFLLVLHYRYMYTVDNKCPTVQPYCTENLRSDLWVQVVQPLNSYQRIQISPVLQIIYTGT